MDIQEIDNKLHALGWVQHQTFVKGTGLLKSERFIKGNRVIHFNYEDRFYSTNFTFWYFITHIRFLYLVMEKIARML